jgi:hypothetical protein
MAKGLIMSVKGSVLIVVLGLLAILAVVGVTFITMSSIDRNTATNFALQTQFDLAAEGTDDYICDILIKDLWSWEKRTTSGNTLLFNRLLSDPGVSGGPTIAANDIDNSTEPCDWPGTLASTNKGGDPWLCSGLDGDNLAPTWWSFRNTTTPTVNRFGLVFSLNTLETSGINMADNLGTGTGTGVWVPDLAFPYEGGIIRVSPTILDHGSMVNLNAHGNRGGASSNWTTPPGMQDAVGQGLFVSDVDPSSTVNMAALLLGTSPGVKPYGRWGEALRPVGENGQVFPENPSLPVTAAGGTGNGKTNSPFTLDEEIQLRSLSDYPSTASPYQGRLRQLTLGSIFSPAKKRVGYTTVGWTSMVLGDGLQANHRNTIEGANSPFNWSQRKPDINTDPIGRIYEAMRDAGGCPVNSGAGNTTNWLTQYLANLEGYRSSQTGCMIKQITLNDSGGGGASNAIAASRQPIISKILIQTAAPDGSSNPPTMTWTIQVQVMSPWKNDCVTDDPAAGLSVPSIRLAVEASTGVPGTVITPNVGPFLASRMTAPQVYTFTVKATDTGSPTIDKVIRNITLRKTDQWNVKLDEVQATDLGNAMRNTNDARYRPIYWENESRGISDPSPVLAVCVGAWKQGQGPGGITTYPTPDAKANTSGIPIRFPRSAPRYDDGTYNSNLPPRALAAKGTFKAFARLGEMNRVLTRMIPALTENGGSTKFFWGTEPGTAGDPEAGQPPWIVKIANADWSKEPTGYTAPPAPFANNLASFERHYKFDWQAMMAEVPNSGVSAGGASTTPIRMNIANALCVGGPWKDTLDNDGDGQTDYNQDWGSYENAADHGHTGGPEMRAMGLVNLNTANPTLLAAMAAGLDLTPTSLSNLVTSLRSSAPITSPAMLLPNSPGNTSHASVTVGTPSPTAGPMEREDEAFVRLSSIATVRSDTFSIYGTVQFITLTKAGTGIGTPTIVRSRRFWALVDRSPTAAYAPPIAISAAYTNPLFIHPRILNFQWLN